MERLCGTRYPCRWNLEPSVIDSMVWHLELPFGSLESLIVRKKVPKPSPSELLIGVLKRLGKSGESAANLSLGGAYNQLQNTAVANARNQGIVMVVAA